MLRNPFDVHISRKEQVIFEKRLQGAMTLYDGRLAQHVKEGAGVMLLGSYFHKDYGTPAIVIKNTENGVDVVHIWVPNRREKRLGEY